MGARQGAAAFTDEHFSSDDLHELAFPAGFFSIHNLLESLLEGVEFVAVLIDLMSLLEVDPIASADDFADFVFEFDYLTVEGLAVDSA